MLLLFHREHCTALRGIPVRARRSFHRTHLHFSDARCPSGLPHASLKKVFENKDRYFGQWREGPFGARNKKSYFSQTILRNFAGVRESQTMINCRKLPKKMSEVQYGDLHLSQSALCSCLAHLRAISWHNLRAAAREGEVSLPCGGWALGTRCQLFFLAASEGCICSPHVIRTAEMQKCFRLDYQMALLL